MNAPEHLITERAQLDNQIAELEDRRDAVDAEISKWERWNVYDRPKATVMEEMMAQQAEALTVGIAKVLANVSPFINMLEGRRFPKF